MKKLSLEEFKTKHYKKSELFNTNSIKGGSTTTGGHITNSTGGDVDSATADADEDPSGGGGGIEPIASNG